MEWNAIAKLTREAFREVVNEWILKAKIRGGQINGPNAFLMPGSLGSETLIEPLVLQKLVNSRVPGEIASIMAKELAAAWNAWAAAFQVHLPGAYPTFAAVPGPVAPPMPTPPFSLARGLSAGEVFLKGPVLAAKLVPALQRHSGKAMGGSPDQAIKGLTDWVDTSFNEWKSLTMLVGVMGKGNVPTFAPPYVPVGPVVMGEAFSGSPVLVGPRFGKIVV